jgi:heme oxygenase (biliverdin-IX-beta and delta-forming)
LTIPRSMQLKEATQGVHAALDQRIMAAQPFASREHYARFLRVQYHFLRDVDVLYSSPLTSGVFADLSERNRLDGVEADLRDLQVEIPAADAQNVVVEWPAALGWLYVAEGSKLGAAILFKLAANLGLDANFGARHLAGHPDGRARHWRSFTAALDAVSLSAVQEEQVIAGASAAFARVREHVEREFGS